jgi:hypothetical protein
MRIELIRSPSNPLRSDYDRIMPPLRNDEKQTPPTESTDRFLQGKR